MATISDTTSSTITNAGAIPSGDWHVDPARSQVHFHTRAMFGLFPVLGRFERFGGTLHASDGGEVSGELRLEAESVRTGIGKRDAHLRTEDFFHADAHPHVTFDLAALTPDGDSHRVSGTLRIRDKTLPIDAGATVTEDGSELQIEARFPIDHSAAGLGWAKPGMVRKVIDADIKLTLTRDQAAN
jgi:polyisoprenoid-binding protein YceI